MTAPHGRGGLVSRRELLAAALLGTGGVALAATIATPEASAQDESGAAVIDLLNVGILLEALLCDAYQHVFDRDVLLDRDRELLVPVLAHELDYVQTLSTAVRERGGQPAAKPSFQFPEEESADRAAALALLSRLEEGVVRTWQGQLVTLRDPELVQRIRPMLLGKARHAAIVAMLQEDEGVPFPSAVEGIGSLGEFLDEIQPYRVVR